MEKAVEEYGMVDDAMDIPGFDFYKENINGIGVVVRNRIQANWIVHDILALVDRGIIHKRTFRFVLAAEELPESVKLISPQDISKAIANSLIDLEPLFSHKKEKLEAIAKEFSTHVSGIENKSASPKSGELGGCWLWILDNTSILARALIDDDRMVVSESGKYLVNLYEFSDSRNLRERQEMTEELAEVIKERFGVECGYFSVLCSDNPNDVPFYNSDHLDDHKHYNVSWEC